MAETPKVYVICDQNCKFEGMTKEQIFTAIMQAVETGEIGDINAGFVQTIKTINGVPLKFFVGTQSLYDTLSEEDKQNLFALITDDTSSEELMQYLNGLADRVSDLETKAALSHAATAARADYATSAGSAGTANKMSSLGVATDNVARPVWFSDSDTPTLPRKDNDFTYNPSTNTLTVDKVKGHADTATYAVNSVLSAVSNAIYLEHGKTKSTGASVAEGKNIDDIMLITVGAEGDDIDFVVGYGVPLGNNKFRFSVDTATSRIFFLAEFTTDGKGVMSMTIGSYPTIIWNISDGINTELVSVSKNLHPDETVYLTFYFI